MNKYSLCIVDDKIPVNFEHIDDRVRIDSVNLKYLVDRREAWGDPIILKFIEDILKKSDWIVSGFTAPEILLICLKNELYRPDIVIFDWEYASFPIGSNEFINTFLQILERSFSIIFIFTGIDKESEIRHLLNQPDFLKYINRIELNNKLEENSTEKLCQSIEKLRTQNFSFKFGAELRRKSLESVDKILIELGKINLEQVNDYFVSNSGSTRDLVDFFGERFKNHLTNFNPDSIIIQKSENTEKKEAQPENKNESESIKSEIAKQLWSYRIYFYPDKTDKSVHKGDIVRKNDKYYMIITADCDLARFWHKNYGYINIIPLYEFKKENQYLKNQFTLTRNEKTLKGIKFKSLSSNCNELPGILVLPFLKINEYFKDFILFPKEINHERIELKNKSIMKDDSLTYSDNFEFKRIATLSEPFLTPVIEHIFSTISGYGTPDYSDSISGLISENFKKILT